MLSKLKLTILLVDDHQDILDFITDDLIDFYEVFQAKDGIQALQLLKQNPIDLIVSDLMMPKMDGFEFCSIVKKDNILKHIPFILLTAKNSLQAKIEGLEYGADAYIDKPFSPSFLQAQIKSLLKNRQLVKEHYSLNNTSETLISSELSVEEEFLESLNQLILKHIDNTSLSVDFLADKLNISRPTLYRRIKHSTNLSPNELINKVRLTKASELLNQGKFKVYEVSSEVGFGSVSHFIRNFHKYFGVSPKEWGTQSIQTKNSKFRFG